MSKPTDICFQCGEKLGQTISATFLGYPTQGFCSPACLQAWLDSLDAKRVDKSLPFDETLAKKALCVIEALAAEHYLFDEDRTLREIFMVSHAAQRHCPHKAWEELIHRLHTEHCQ